MSSHPSALSAAADDRKARLAKLKSLKRKAPADEVASPTSDRQGSQPPAPALSAPEQNNEAEGPAVPATDEDITHHLSLRNYDPAVRGPKLGFEDAPKSTQPTLEEQAAAIEQEVRTRTEQDQENEGIDLLKLQPKKPNWDLKRDLDRKLEVLEPRTQNAINALVRKRVEEARAKRGSEQREEGRDAEEDLEAAGVDGAALVEGLRVREREEEEEERREREEVDGMV